MTKQSRINILFGLSTYISLMISYICINLISKLAVHFRSISHFGLAKAMDNISSFVFCMLPFFVFFISGTIYNILYQKNKDQKSGFCRLLMFSTLITDAFLLLTVAAIFIADYFVIFNDIGAILSPIIYSIISIVESLIAMFIYYVKYS